MNTYINPLVFLYKESDFVLHRNHAESKQARWKQSESKAIILTKCRILKTNWFGIVDYFVLEYIP